MIKPIHPHQLSTMNAPDEFDQLLTRQLRNSQEYLADDGFTAGVMAQLGNRPVISRRAQWLITGIPLTLISGLVFSQLPVQDIGLMIGSSLAGVEPVTMIKLGALLSGAIILTSLGWCARQARLL
ncbi:MAG TPA: hypothetical protein VLE50_00560 [Cellvibrio sp.]|nr:hypothetical protein [Cellvibrio sp.]